VILCEGVLFDVLFQFTGVEPGVELQGTLVCVLVAVCKAKHAESEAQLKAKHTNFKITHNTTLPKAQTQTSIIKQNSQLQTTYPHPSPVS
jgi:hypothetical protein